jgi:hypothetical protein
MSKMKNEEESSRKNAEEIIEKLKQESKDKVCTLSYIAHFRKL